MTAITNANYTAAVADGAFASAESVSLNLLTSVTSLPVMLAAKKVVVDNAPALTALEGLPVAETVRLWNLPSVITLPDLLAATDVSLVNLSALTVYPAMPRAKRVFIAGCGASGRPAVPDGASVFIDGVMQ